MKTFRSVSYSFLVLLWLVFSVAAASSDSLQWESSLDSVQTSTPPPAVHCLTADLPRHLTWSVVGPEVDDGVQVTGTCPSPLVGSYDVLCNLGTWAVQSGSCATALPTKFEGLWVATIKMHALLKDLSMATYIPAFLSEISILASIPVNKLFMYSLQLGCVEVQVALKGGTIEEIDNLFHFIQDSTSTLWTAPFFGANLEPLFVHNVRLVIAPISPMPSENNKICIWPIDPLPQCDFDIHGSESATPIATSSIVYAGDYVEPGVTLAGKDHLWVQFKVNTSYAINEISGGTSKVSVPLTPPAYANDNPSYYVEYLPPTQNDCTGTVNLRLWIGTLNLWGFTLINEVIGGNTVWYLNGTLRIKAAKYLAQNDDEVGDVPLWMLTDVSSVTPFKISIKSTYNINLNQPLTVYGTTIVKSAIVLFREWEAPVSGLTVHYVLSVQFPYQLADVVVNAPTSTANGIAAFVPPYIINAASDRLAYYSVDSQYCPTASDGTKGDWCYHVVHAYYRITDLCLTPSTVLTYTGKYSLALTVGCRAGVAASAGCSIPSPAPAWAVPVADFQMRSDSVCTREHTYDPTTKVHAHVMARNPTTHASQTTFVPDNRVEFYVYLTVDDPANFGLKLDSIRMLNISFGKIMGTPSSPAFAKIYSPTTWTGIGPLLVPEHFTDCDGQNLPACKDLSTLPIVWWTFMLNSTVLQLDSKLPFTLSLSAGLEVSYSTLTGSKKVQILSSTIKLEPATAITFNQNNLLDGPANVPTTVAATSNLAGVVIGCVLGAVCLLAAAVVFVVKQRQAKFNKQTDETA